MRSHLLSMGLFILLFIQLNASGQTEIGDQGKIKQVENGLVGSIQLEGETPGNIQERMAHFHNQGLSIAVIKDYHIIWAKGYGWADSSLKISVATQTLFQAASISKSLNRVCP